MIELKPNTTFNFSKDDHAFILELIKVGFVHILSSQVSFLQSESNGICFKEWGAGDNKCKGLKLPENWLIEGIFHKGEMIQITFGVEKGGKT